MSENKSESHEPAAKSAGANKLVIGLAGGALLLSLVNTVLLVLNPTAKKLEVFNEELKTDLAESIATIHKKVDGLRSAELEWQAVLKKASEKPDATYKVVNSKDGFLTLTEIVSGESPAAEKESAEHHK
jgi:hypothetical protein